MLGWLLLVFAGLSLSTVLDSNGSDDNQDDRANDDSGDAGHTSNTRILTAGADQLFLRDSTPTTINALAGDDTITTIGNQDLKALLGPGDDEIRIRTGEAEVFGGDGDDTIRMTNGSLSAFLGLGDDRAHTRPRSDTGCRQF